MMRWLLFICFSLLAACGAARAGEASSKRMRETFAWFDQLGFEDTSQAKFVWIRTGSAKATRGGGMDYDESLGWLLEDRGETFRAVLVDLTVGLFTKRGKDEKEMDYCGYREAALEEEVRKLIGEVKQRGYFEKWGKESFWHGHELVSRQTQLFVLARACQQRGLGALGRELWDAVDATVRRDDADWEIILEDELADALLVRLQWEFRHEQASWAALLARCEASLKRCPNHYDSMRKTLEKLKASLQVMAAEEAKRAGKPLSALEKLPPEERARELVWRLCDDVDGGPEEESWPRPWPWKARDSNGAKDQLLAMGFAAVPALLQEMRAPHLSRNVRRSSDDGTCFPMDGTRPLAMQILEEIAGVNFSMMVDFDRQEEDKKWSAATKAVADWWAQVETRGEKQWLVEKVSAGEVLATHALRTRYPEELSKALAAGVKSSEDYPRRMLLLNQLSKEKTAEAEAALREELRAGPMVGHRAAAALALRRMGVEEGDLAMLQELKKHLAAVKDGPLEFVIGGEEYSNRETEEGTVHYGDRIGYAIDVLAGSSSVKTLRALLDLWRDLPANLRMVLVRRLELRGNSKTWLAMDPPTPASNAVTQEILLNALGDATVFPGYFERTRAGARPAPRICDIAGQALHGQWPHKFAFDLVAVESERDRQRLAIYNAHLRELGLPEVPVPSPRPKVPKDQRNNVAKIEVDPVSAKLPADWENRLDQLRGKPLTPEAMKKLVQDYAAKPVEDTTGLHLSALREGNDTGVILRILMPPGKTGKRPHCLIWHTATIRALVQNNRTAGLVTQAAEGKLWRYLGFEEHASTAFKAPQSEPIEVNLTLRRQWKTD